MNPFLLILLFGVATDIPPVPPLPTSNWPAQQPAESFAHELLVREPAAELARALAAEPELMPGVLRNLGTALMSRDPVLGEALGAYLAVLARTAATETKLDVRSLATIVIVDPLRYINDNAFRARMNALLPGTMAGIPTPVVRSILDELTSSASLDIDTFESVAAAAGILQRTGSSRRIPYDRTLELPDDVSGPIEASFFSLSSAYFKPAEVRRFLESVHAASPKRNLVVLGDTAIRKSLPSNATFIDDHSRAFTPWPRDPFILARSANGGVVFVNRPNAQPDREEDQNMVRAVVQQWDDPSWTVGPTPFHNGHILLTATTVWISMHTVEARVLALLGLDHVPAETFSEPAALSQYLDAVRQAAGELQDLYRRPVRFVHPLNPSSDLMRVVGGGAGVDLDSIVTILPPSNALVGDIGLGVNLAVKDLAQAAKAYGIRDTSKVIEAQRALKAEALQRFLDLVAEELQRDGMTVRRLPLLNVPASQVRGDVPTDFLITWNNVVLENRRAEGFASLMPSADLFVRRIFGQSGYKLVLFPPLIRSIELGGGYRCASNHLRPRPRHPERSEGPQDTKMPHH